MLVDMRCHLFIYLTGGNLGVDLRGFAPGRGDIGPVVRGRGACCGSIMAVVKGEECLMDSYEGSGGDGRRRMPVAIRHMVLVLDRCYLSSS